MNNEDKKEQFYMTKNDEKTTGLVIYQMVLFTFLSILSAH